MGSVSQQKNAVKPGRKRPSVNEPLAKAEMIFGYKHTYFIILQYDLSLSRLSKSIYILINQKI